MLPVRYYRYITCDRSEVLICNSRTLTTASTARNNLHGKYPSAKISGVPTRMAIKNFPGILPVNLLNAKQALTVQKMMTPDVTR